VRALAFRFRLLKAIAVLGPTEREVVLRVTVRQSHVAERRGADAPWILARWAVSGEEPSAASMFEVLGAEPE
jgi:hypothetical protein